MTLKITLKTRVTLKIERTKDLSNAENFQWDYKGLTFLDNNGRQISVASNGATFCNTTNEGWG